MYQNDIMTKIKTISLAERMNDFETTAIRKIRQHV